MNLKFKVGLALGGGGVRGLAHMGVLEVLKKENIPIDLVVGTSMGAIIGGAFCKDPDINFLKEKVKGLIARKEILELESFLGKSEPEEKSMVIQRLIHFVKDLYLWNLHRVRKWLVKAEPIEAILEELINNVSFSQLQIPFACVATDIKSGEEMVLKEGDLLEAVLASSSIPGIFPPVKRNNRDLVDGGVVSPIPVEAARKLGADFVIGVNVEGSRLKGEFGDGLDILFQVDQIRISRLNRMSLLNCDFLIKPEVGDLSWADFSKGEECIQQGEEAAKRRLPELKAAIATRKRVIFLKRLFLFRKGKS